MTRKRYAIVGTGSRSEMYSTAILKDYSHSSALVAFCDSNRTRMDYYNRRLSREYDITPVPAYGPDEFEYMLRNEAVDVVIVTCIDRMHHEYICKALESGCDVMTEKPMTVDMNKAKLICETVERTGRSLRVMFNYRYAPRHSKVRELLDAGVIGTVHSVHFEWMLDTRHGADYFRRWHRDKSNSGGLIVHKASHHFDLVNWWLQTRPVTVFGMGRRVFYGRDNGERNALYRPYHRSTGSPAAEGDPFALDLNESEHLTGLYLQAEHEDAYFRDQNVFADGVSIEDDMSVMVRYENDAVLTYHLSAYAPWEGYRVSFTGSKGRLEYAVAENSYISGGDGDINRISVHAAGSGDYVSEPVKLLVRPHWRKPERIEIEEGEGGHGGGDRRLLDDAFGQAGPDPLERAADYRAGAWSIICGIAANRSFASGRPVNADEIGRRIGIIR